MQRSLNSVLQLKLGLTLHYILYHFVTDIRNILQPVSFFHQFTGAFLIPIVIFNVFGAMPIVYMEMIMGQYSQSGAVPAWNVCPILKGLRYLLIFLV